MMRALIILAALALPVEALTIRQAIVEGNRQLIEQTVKIPHHLTPNITKSFTLVSRKVNTTSLELIISSFPKGGAVVPGYMILDYGLEMMDELSRQFVIAHEFGHQRLNHYEARTAMVEKLVPADVLSPEGQAQLIAMEFSRTMREQSHTMEFDADLEAGKILLSLGWTRAQILQCILRFQRAVDSPTHPGSSKRFLNLMNRLPG